MMRIVQPRLGVLDGLSGGRVGELVRQGEQLRQQIDAIGQRLETHAASGWLARKLDARAAQEDRALMEARRQEAALLTCELVGLIAEINAGQPLPCRQALKGRRRDS